MCFWESNWQYVSISLGDGFMLPGIKPLHWPVSIKILDAIWSQYVNLQNPHGITPNHQVQNIIFMNELLINLDNTLLINTSMDKLLHSVQYKVYDKITYPLPIFNSCMIKVTSSVTLLGM